MIKYIEDRLSVNNFLFNTTICNLHKPCIDKRQCTTGSSLLVLDFDKFKELYCKSSSIKSCKSVDALYFSSDKIFFVEIKGFKKYLEYNEFDKSNVTSQIEKYKFSDKYYDSYDILLKYLCEDRKFQIDIERFYSLDKYFIVVTDVNLRENPIKSITEMLNFLAETSNTEDYCYRQLSGYIENISFVTNKPIKQALSFCEDFDREIIKLVK